MTLHLLPRTSRHGGGRRGSMGGSMSSGMSSTSSHGNMMMSSHSTGSSSHMRLSSSSSKREHIQKYKRRLDAITGLATNSTCSDCPEPHPTWASLLVPLVGASSSSSQKRSSNTDTRLGVLCCFKCYSYHFQMGQAVCHVKNMKMAEEWKEDEIEALERAGGNAIVNSIYEADLTSATFDKHVVLSDPEADAIARKEFIQKKYKELAYFDASKFQEQILAKKHDNNVNHRKSDSAKKSKRCRSHEDMPLDSSSFSSLTSKTGAIKSAIKDIIKKPHRRRSHSFQGALFRLENNSNDEEDEDEHTDEERSAYNLPGHLGVSKPNNNLKKSKKKKGVQQRLRGSSLPKLMRAPSIERSKTDSTDKRAPSSERKRNESTERRRQRRLSGSGSGAIPSQDDLGYGSSASTDKSIDSQSSDRTGSFTDSSAKRANRRRRSSLGSGSSLLSSNSSNSINNTVHEIAVNSLDATSRRSNRRSRSGEGRLSSASSHNHRMDTSSQKSSSSRLSDSSNPRRSNRRRRGSMGSGSQQQSQSSCTDCGSSGRRLSDDSCKTSSAPRAPRRAISDDDNTIDGDDGATTSCDSCRLQVVKPSTSFSSTASAKKTASMAASSRLANSDHSSTGKAPRAPRRLMSDDDDSVMQTSRQYESDASQGSRAPQQPRRMMSDDDDSVLNAMKPRRMISDDDDSVMNAMKPRRMMSDDDDSVMNAMKPRRMMSDDDDSVMQAMKNSRHTTTSANNNHQSQSAPRVPRRMISDDENSVISGLSVQKQSSSRFAPTSDHAKIMPRQPRRVSLPGVAKQKKDDSGSINDEDSIVQQYSNKKYTGIDVYSPHHRKRASVGNTLGKAAPKYGVKMGYGYESSVSRSSESEQDGGVRRNSKAKHERAHRRGSTGDGISAADAPALGCFLETSHVRPKKILDETSLGSATKSSNDDVAGIGPSARQQVFARRRGSTGGASALEMPPSSSSESLSNHFRANPSRQLPMVPSLGGSSASSGDISSGLSKNDPRWSFSSLSEHLNASSKPEKVVIKKGSNHSSDNHSVGVLSMLSGFSAVSEFTGFSFESKSSMNSHSSSELKFNRKAPRLSQLDEESTTSHDHNGSFAWATEYSVSDDPVPSLEELGYEVGEEKTQPPNDAHVCLAESETLETTWERSSSSKRDPRLEDPMYSFVSLSQAFEASTPQADGDLDSKDETTEQPPAESHGRASRQGSCGVRLRSSRASTSSGSAGGEALGRPLNASSRCRLSSSSTAPYSKSTQQQQGSSSLGSSLLGDSSSESNRSAARESPTLGKMLNYKNRSSLLQRQDSVASEASDIASVVSEASEQSWKGSDIASVASVVSEASEESWKESLLEGTEGPPGVLSVLADESCSTTDSSLLHRCSSVGTTDEPSPSSKDNLCVGKPTIISDNHHSHPRPASICGGNTTEEQSPPSATDLSGGEPTIISDNHHSHHRRTSSCGGGTTDELSPSSKDNLSGGTIISDNHRCHPRRSSSFGNTAA